MIVLSELHEKLITYLLEKNTSVSGLELSKYCNVSLATIRKEILVLNQELQTHGCEIQSKKAAGYSLVIYDEKKAESFKQEVNDGKLRNMYMKIHKYMECYQIVRKMLASSSYITLEQLCDEYYCSRSTILRYIHQLKDLLAPFHLTIKNSFNKGFYIVGNEWDIRIYLQYQHKIYKALPAEIKQNETAFSSLFYERVYDYEVLKNSLLDTLQAFPEYVFPYVYIFKIVNCILLNKARSAYRDQIHFRKEQEILAKENHTYVIAEAIYQHLPYDFSEQVCEKDILTLSAYLLSYQSIKDKQLIPSSDFQQFHAFTLTLFQHTYSSMYEQEAFPPSFIDEFSCFLYTFHNRLLFSLSIDEEIVEHIKHDGVFTTDLCVAFAKEYELCFHQKLQETDVLSPYYLLHQIRVSTRWLIKQRFLITSMYGVEYAQTLGHYIRRAYRYNIEQLDAIELFQLPSIDLKQYDALLTDIDVAKQTPAYLNDIPIIPIEFKRDFRKDINIENYLNLVRKTRIHQLMFDRLMYEKTDLYTKDEVFSFIADSYAHEINNRDDFIRDLQQRDSYINGERTNKIVLLTTFLKAFANTSILVMVNKQSFIWNEELSQIFIFYNYGVNPYESAFAISNIVKYFVDCSIVQFDELLQKDANDLLNII